MHRYTLSLSTKKFNESAGHHERYEWRKDTSEERGTPSRCPYKETNIANAARRTVPKEASGNKQEPASITIAVLFCGVHDLRL